MDLLLLLPIICLVSYVLEECRDSRRIRANLSHSSCLDSIEQIELALYRQGVFQTWKPKWTNVAFYDSENHLLPRYRDLEIPHGEAQLQSR